MAAVLVIRPEPDATATAARLATVGHGALVAPVLVTECLAPPLPPDADLIALTSANAVRALAGRADFQRLARLPVVAVGAATALAARAAGFVDVVSADGRAGDVAETIAARRLPAGSVVLYPAAEIRGDPLEERLARLGLDARLVTVYRTVAVESWPEATVRAVAVGGVDVVQVMSRRSGEALVGLMRRHGLAAVARRIAVHALAREVVVPDLAADFGSVTIAPAPTLAALIGLLAGWRSGPAARSGVGSGTGQDMGPGMGPGAGASNKH